MGLFCCEEQANFMWYIARGKLRYDMGPALPKLAKILQCDSFVSEIALWLHWNYKGRAISRKPFDVHAFHDVARYTRSLSNLQTYAAAFVEQVRLADDFFIEVEFEVRRCMEALLPIAEESSIGNPSRSLERSALG